ncbi:MAG: LytR/AlgR family response regulator transcription factor [Rhodothermaceae bacterium]
MTKIDILILEDEPLHAIKLQRDLRELGYNVIDVVDNADDFFTAFHATEPDLAILDIRINDSIDGIEIAKKICEDDSLSRPFIFLTSDNSLETFERAKTTKPCAFLVKPFDKFSLQCTIELAIVQHSTGKSNKAAEVISNGIINRDNIFVKKNKKVVKVSLQNIIYIEVESKYCTVFAEEGKFLLRMSLKDLIHKLPENLFIRTHRNYLVNINEIIEFDFDDYICRVKIKDVPVGRSYRHTINEQLMMLS